MDLSISKRKLQDSQPGVEGFKDVYDTIVRDLKRFLNSDEIKEDTNPWDLKTKNLIKTTLGNPKWLETRNYATGNVSAEGIVDALNYGTPIDPNDLLGYIEKYESSLAWWDQWVPKISKWSSELETICKALEKDVVANKQDSEKVIALTKAAIDKVKALEFPGKSFMQYAKPTMDGVPTVKKFHGIVAPVFTPHPKTNIKEIPALTPESIKVIAKLISDCIEGKDAFTTKFGKHNFYLGMDFDTPSNIIQDADEDTYMELFDYVYHQAVTDFYWTPEYTRYDLLKPLLRWVARSVS